MRRSASEIISELEQRIAKLEGKTSSLQYLRELDKALRGGGTSLVYDLDTRRIGIRDGESFKYMFEDEELLLAFLKERYKNVTDYDGNSL